MNCQKAEIQILLEDSKEITPANASALAKHIENCNSCTLFRKQLRASHLALQPANEPSAQTIDAILQAARSQSTPKTSKILILKPLIGIAASLIIGTGLFFTHWSPDQNIELLISETELLSSDDQLASIMTGGFSDDDLAFNYLMSYDEG